MMSESMRRSTKLAKAAAMSPSLLALTAWTLSPSARAAVSTSFVSPAEFGLLGLTRLPIVVAFGIS
jgi:hypothetical protein